jgi:hypothetical protein
VQRRPVVLSEFRLHHRVVRGHRVRGCADLCSIAGTVRRTVRRADTSTLAGAYILATDRG